MQFSFWFWGRGERESEPLRRGERVKKGREPLSYIIKHINYISEANFVMFYDFYDM